MSYANAWTIVNNNYKRKGKSFTVSDKIDIIAKIILSMLEHDDLALQVGCPH